MKENPGNYFNQPKLIKFVTLFVSLKWRGGIISEQIWTLIMMSVAALLAIGITSKFNVPYFSLVVIWAILGIFLRWYESDFTIVVYGSVFLVIIMIVHLIYVVSKDAG